MTKTADHIAEIGIFAGLKYRALKVYVDLMLERFGTSEDSYLVEWAERFANGTAWTYADGCTREVLTRLAAKHEVDVDWLRIQGKEIA